MFAPSLMNSSGLLAFLGLFHVLLLIVPMVIGIFDAESMNESEPPAAPA